MIMNANLLGFTALLSFKIILYMNESKNLTIESINYYLVVI
jgi:hypothetical protein